MAVQYPPWLPLPLFEGYDMNHQSPLIRSELSTGRARQRRRFTSVPTLANVSWVFDVGQAMTFESWFQWDLSDGAEWASIPLKTPIGAKTYECRFVEMYSGPKLVGPKHWQFEATLEIRERQTNQFMKMNDIFDIAVNREWPAVL